jgi:hypothetical protein
MSTAPPSSWSPAYAPGFPPPHPAPPGPPPPQIPIARRGPGWRRIALWAAVAAFVFGVVGGTVGVVVGTHIADNAAAKPAAAPAPAPPSPELIRAQTVNLCTRFAAAYAAVPVPQNSAADIVPATNYIADAVRDNPIADTAIRSAVATSLRLFQDHASKLSREPVRGAVQPATGWTAAANNDADDHVWSLCSSYQG